MEHLENKFENETSVDSATKSEQPSDVGISKNYTGF